MVASLKKDPKFKVVVGPGEEIRNLGFNSNPKKPKNRELLDPKVRGAIAHAINRNQIVNVVFRNYAKPAYSLLTSISAPYLNTDLAPESYDPALANAMLDKLGYKRGSGGVRVANGHKMSYAIITPSETPGMNREFDIVKQDLAKIGIAVTQKALDATTAFSEITAPKNQYLSYDMMMWDWIGYIDPDYILTVVNCDQYGNRSDTGYCNKAYDKLYAEQGVTIDPAKRKQIIWQMQKILYRDKPYIQLAQLDLIFGFAKGWNGINPPYLNGLSKIPWEQLQKSRRLDRARRRRLRRKARALRGRHDVRGDHPELRDLPRRAGRRDDHDALPRVHAGGAPAGAVELGLDKSKWQQYVLYLGHLAHGDMGRSFQNRQPVFDQLWTPLLNTLPMILLGTVFSILLGVLTGVVAAWRRGTFADTASVWTGLAFYSLPTQWLGLMLILYLAGPTDCRLGHLRPVPGLPERGLWPELTSTGSSTWCCPRSRWGSSCTASTR